MNAPTAYPAPRARVGAPAPQLSEVYGRMESTQGEVTLADTDADVFLFSGTPALIRLSARTNGALVTLTDRLGRETHEVTVLAGSPVELRIPRDRVVGRNLVALANAQLSVEGYYAATEEAIHAATPSPPGFEAEAVAVEPPTPAADPLSRAWRGSSPDTYGFRRW